jgi:hypothetical protein
MKCNDYVKDLKGCIHITLNTGRCFTSSCKQLTSEVEKFESLQVSGQAVRLGLPAEPTSLHIANKTYSDYSRCWKCFVLFSGEQRSLAQISNFSSVSPQQIQTATMKSTYVQANSYTKPILL